MHTSLPYIQQGLDYLMNNGPQVVSVLKGMAAAFVAMKFSPALERLLGGAGSLCLVLQVPEAGANPAACWGR